MVLIVIHRDLDLCCAQSAQWEMSVMFHFIFLNKTYCKNITQINLWDLLEYFIHVHALVRV